MSLSRAQSQSASSLNIQSQSSSLYGSSQKATNYQGDRFINFRGLNEGNNEDISEQFLTKIELFSKYDKPKQNHQAQSQGQGQIENEEETL